MTLGNRHCVNLGVLFLATLASSAFAQPSSATVTWQVSQDNVNWLGWTSVEDPSVHEVQIRALLTYQAPANYLTRFGLSMADPTVTGRNGVGLGDTITRSYYRYNVALMLGDFRYTSSRNGNQLKIDAIGDTAPPGQGTGWVTSFQDSPSLFPLTDDLPVIVLYQYTLVLDDTPGVRDINGVFRQLNSNVPNSFVGIWAPGSSPNTWVNYAIPTSIVPAHVTVYVPAPSPLTALLLAASPLATRRRRA